MIDLNFDRTSLRCSFMVSKALEILKMSQQEELFALKVKFAKLFKLTSFRGWDDANWGHYSIIISEPGRPSRYLTQKKDIPFNRISADEVVEIDAAGSPVDPGCKPAPSRINRIVHESCSAAKVVVHLHNQHAVAVAGRTMPLRPLDQTALCLEPVKYLDMTGPGLSSEQEAQLASLSNESQCILMRGHGLMIHAVSIEQAYCALYFLVRACQVDLLLDANADFVGVNPGVAEEFRKHNFLKSADFCGGMFTAECLRFGLEP